MRKMFSEKQIETMIENKLESLGLKLNNGILEINKETHFQESIEIKANKETRLPNDVYFNSKLFKEKNYENLSSDDNVITLFEE